MLRSKNLEVRIMNNEYKNLKLSKREFRRVKAWKRVIDFTEIKKGGVSIDKILNCL